MPIYEYRCQACGVELEKLQKINDPLLRECPECGRETLVKLISASSFRLKGGGWYETDFKTGKKKNGVGEADSAGDSDGKAAASAASAAAKSGADSSGNAVSAGARTESAGEKGESAGAKKVVKEATSTPASPAASSK